MLVGGVLEARVALDTSIACPVHRLRHRPLRLGAGEDADVTYRAAITDDGASNDPQNRTGADSSVC